MRKITEECIRAFWDGWYFKKSNTTVDLKPMPHGLYEIKMYLFKNEIARKYNGYLVINSCGWYSNTTKERLNGILKRIGFAIKQHKGEWKIINLKTNDVSEFKDGMQFQLTELHAN